MQVDHGEETRGVEKSDVGDDGGTVPSPTELGLHAVDAEPAVFVKRKSDRIDTPRGDRSNRRRVRGLVEYPPSLRACGFGPRPVDAEEADRHAAAVQKFITAHPQARRRVDRRTHRCRIIETKCESYRPYDAKARTRARNSAGAVATTEPPQAD